MKVRWLELALDDLVEIADYIAQDNPTATRRIVSRLKSSIKTLIKAPEMGRPGRVYGTRELVVPKTPFIVPYRVVESEIQILRILHGTRDWPCDF